ncbi:condensin-2 complex subunit G2-like, partial [Homarus americanus]|uniref:condensin-2 complex subunit G2-like n=1 Tax=Homarus americanus TaxID=6706 RepID=UPI001C44CF23
GSKRSTVDLQEVLAELNRKQKEQIWVSLYSWTDVQLLKLVEDNVPEGDVVEPDQPPDEERKGPPQKDGSVSQSCQDPPQIEGSASQSHQYLPIKEPSEPYNAKLMEGILQFASMYLNTFKEEEIFIPDKLLEFAVLLHGMVTVLEGAVQAGVLSLCELWWLRKLEEREHLIGNVLPLLLDVATGKTARKKDVIRLWSLNDALQVSDLDNSENERFVERLVASAACTVFLSCDEGVKWIAGLFSWASLVPLLHQSIKTVLPDCIRPQIAKYAEVYFRAWKSSQGDVKKTVEENCLQDFMYAAVHVNPMSGRLSTNLHHLLHHIHRQKRHHAVATTIYCLYDPFLWRSLK